MALLTAVCQGCLPNLRLLLPSLEEVLARDARGIGGSDEYQMWQMDTARRDLLHELAPAAALHGARLPRRLPRRRAAAAAAIARRRRAAAPLRAPARRAAPGATTHARTHARTHTHTHARTRARAHAHARTHARTHTRTHARAHARTRTHARVYFAAACASAHTHTLTPRQVYDAVKLVNACDALNMAYSAMQQNDAGALLACDRGCHHICGRGYHHMLIYRAHIVAGEFLTLLGDHLEEALKGTRQAKLLLQEFGGELLQQVLYEADGVRRVSERKEAFLQIELPVKGHPSILRAFDSLLEGERLEGENAYQLDDTVDAASGRKVPGAKVDAQKRICLGKLPSTLILQLKRFELDYETMANLKLNSECAFPSVLDLGPYTKRGVEAQARGGGARAESPPAGGA
eukprot:scaffold53417_cov57-Phaeocystis_antarctica.AAC.1